jgi:hypothetical protein
MKFVFTKDNVVIGITNDSNGLADYDSMMTIDEFQKVDIGNNVVDGAFISKDNIPSQCVSKLDFMNRFTFMELGAIEASVDPFVKVLQRQQQIADYIDLKDINTIQGIGYLATVGLITQDRMNIILNIG